MFGKKEGAPQPIASEKEIKKFCKHSERADVCEQCKMGQSEAMQDAEKVKLAARTHKGFMGHDPEGKLNPSKTDYNEGERWIAEGILRPDELKRVLEFQRKIEEETAKLQTALENNQKILADLKRNPKKYFDSY